ncbi:acyl-CoA dehydrogenase family protein [Kitasatospora kifunensis]|uniref:Acyl-CoA oxidase n=1 Tax=Kitasatospora kifunensis TaxID=58351 RepID=A0A7W7R892_KITKI|nr:acyl-CoA dehydrogenase [Kitasatospora kifunensis]MBB4926636.1 acyl-CoA oxidase [Kitasatospora kifunensis]
MNTEHRRFIAPGPAVLNAARGAAPPGAGAPGAGATAAGLSADAGRVPPPYATEVMKALFEEWIAAEPDPLSRDTSAHLRLRRLAEVLPPATELFADTALLSSVGAATALADPALYQTFLSHYILCAGSVALLGEPGTGIADDLAHVRAKGSFMVTEVGDASSHLGIRTVAEFDPSTLEFVLHTPDDRAAKFSSVAALGLPQQAVVCARVSVDGRDGGVFSFLVDITDERGAMAPGVELSSPLAVQALPLPYALVRFRRVRLPYQRWLRDGAEIDDSGVLRDPTGGQDARLQRTLSVGQALWATLPTALAAMGARSAVLGWRFSASRRSHGRLAPQAPVLVYRTQQHAVVGALAEAFGLRCVAEAARGLWSAAAGVGGAAQSTPQLVPQPAPKMAFSPWAAVDSGLALYKALTTRATARLVGECQHRCGVSGQFAINRLPGYLGFAHAFDSAGGDSTLILLDAGRLLAEQAEQAEPVEAVEQVEPVDPTDPDWWPAIAAALTARLAVRLGADLRRRRATGASGLELWNPLLDQAVQLGEAQAQLLAANAVAQAVAGAGAGAGAAAPPPPALGDLAALYGLGQARRLSGPLLAAEVLDPATVRHFPEALDQLCDRLAPHLPAIAEALDPDQGQATAPLGASDYPAALVAALTWHRSTS